MKAALIPPRGYEHTALESNIHLVLPLKSLTSNLEYLATYVAARKRGDYIILDNGCAEGQLVDGRTLLDFARVIGAHEIVAPDVMGEPGPTLEATRNFLEGNDEAADYNIMAVLQGSTHDERAYLLKTFARISAITAIGIPKVLSTHQGCTTRHEIVEFITKKYPDRFDIHLLGLNGAFPNEILQIAFGNKVRSMDSAQPYKLAQAGKMMAPSVAWAPRSDTYFTHKKGVDPRTLAWNIQVFKDWAALHEG